MNQIPPPIASLALITLGQWVEFQRLYGQELDDRHAAILQMPAGSHRTAESVAHSIDMYLKHYAFFTGQPLDAVRRMDAEAVLQAQGEAFVQLKAEETALNFRRVHRWNGELWKIQPVVRNLQRPTAAEEDLAAGVALTVADLQDGRHEALYDLCALYLRRPGEAYHDGMADERRELMKRLPLSIALCVKQYFEYWLRKLHALPLATAR